MTGTSGEMRNSSNEFLFSKKSHILKQGHIGALDILISLHVAYPSS